MRRKMHGQATDDRADHWQMLAHEFLFLHPAWDNPLVKFGGLPQALLGTGRRRIGLGTR
jgi:hypothetical protein